MKTSLICGAALAILGLAAAPVNAQTQTTTSSTSTGYVQTSKIIGTKVKTAKGEEVGVVKDVVLDRSNGCMAYTVLSAGGGDTRVTGQGKLVAVPWSVYTVSPDASYLTVSVERDRIYNAPVFEYSRISDTAFTNSVYTAFGVTAGVGVSNAATTTTGASTTTGAATTNVNSMNNPPPPAEGPSASASPSASATSSASPKSATRGGGYGKASPSQSTSEGSSSTSGKKSSRKGSEESTAGKATGQESSAEGATSPSGKKSSHKKGGIEQPAASASPGGEQE